MHSCIDFFHNGDQICHSSLTSIPWAKCERTFETSHSQRQSTSFVLILFLFKVRISVNNSRAHAQSIRLELQSMKTRQSPPLSEVELQEEACHKMKRSELVKVRVFFLMKVSGRYVMYEVTFLKELWCSVGGQVKHENFVSKMFIRFKFSPSKDNEVGVSSVSSSHRGMGRASARNFNFVIFLRW